MTNREAAVALMEAAEARAARAEAHAERLASALAGCLEQVEGCWLNHYGENPEGSPVPPHIDQARQALSAYRGDD